MNRNYSNSASRDRHAYDDNNNDNNTSSSISSSSSNNNCKYNYNYNYKYSSSDDGGGTSDRTNISQVSLLGHSTARDHRGNRYYGDVDSSRRNVSNRDSRMHGRRASRDWSSQDSAARHDKLGSSSDKTQPRTASDGRKRRYSLDDYL